MNVWMYFIAQDKRKYKSITKSWTEIVKYDSNIRWGPLSLENNMLQEYAHRVTHIIKSNNTEGHRPQEARLLNYFYNYIESSCQIHADTNLLF